MNVAAVLLFAAASGGAATLSADPITVPILAGSGVASTAGQLVAGEIVVPVIAGTGSLELYRPTRPALTTIGSSSTAVGTDGSSYQQRIAALSTGPAITNIGAGGTSAETIRNTWLAQTLPVRSQAVIAQFGGNFMNTPGSVAVAFSFYREIIDELAANGQASWIAAPKFNDAGMGWGGGENVYHHKLRALHRADNPARLVNWAEIVRNAPGFTGQDAIDQAANVMPTSWRFDASHANQLGKDPLGDEFVRWIDGEFNVGGLPFVPSFAYCLSSLTTNRAAGGRIASVPFLGDLTGVTVTSGNASISAAIEDGAIWLRNATGGPLLAGRYTVPLTIANASRSYTTSVYAFAGSATTAPSRVELDGNFWFSDPEPLAGFAASPGFTLAFDPEHLAGTDSVDMYPLFLGAGAVASLRRVNTTNVYRFTLQNAAAPGSSAFTMNLPAHGAAAGRKRYVITCDAVAGTATAVIDGVVQSPVAFTPFANFNTGPASWSPSQIFANSAAGGNPFRGRYSQLWVGLGAINPASADALFYMPDGTARNLGATGQVAGINPVLLLRGSAGDMYADAANSAASGSRLIAQPKGVATTLALGAVEAELTAGSITVPLLAGSGTASVVGALVASSITVTVSAGVAALVREVFAFGATITVPVLAGTGEVTLTPPTAIMEISLPPSRRLDGSGRRIGKGA